MNPTLVPFLLGDSEHLRSPRDPPVPSVSHLPKVQAQNGEVFISIDTAIRRILGVVDLWMNPGALVIWIVNLPGLPLALRKEKELKVSGSQCAPHYVPALLGAPGLPCIPGSESLVVPTLHPSLHPSPQAS